MNCKRIEDLIPLYVEGDLEPHRAEAVASHLATCDRCGGLAAEFIRSQQWLRSYEPPDFDAAFFDQLRASTIDQIEQQKARRWFFPLLAGGWHQRPLLAAAALALIAIFAALVFYSYLGKSGTSQDQVVRQDTGGEEEASVAATLNAGGDVSVPPVELRAPRKPTTRHGGAGRRAQPARRKQAPSNVDQSFISNRQPPAAESGRASEQVVRIEMQTSDPNIRIIWLAPETNNPNTEKPVSDTD